MVEGWGIQGAQYICDACGPMALNRWVCSACYRAGHQECLGMQPMDSYAFCEAISRWDLLAGFRVFLLKLAVACTYCVCYRFLVFNVELKAYFWIWV